MTPTLRKTLCVAMCIFFAVTSHKSIACTINDITPGQAYRVTFYGQNKCQTLNVRGYPSMEGRIINTLTYSQKVYCWTYTADNGGWAYVGWTFADCAWQRAEDGWNHNLFHPYGWVSIKYLEPIFGDTKQLEGDIDVWKDI